MVKSKRVYGLFKSPTLNYYCYQDPKTVHNIIGQTDRGDKFSIYILDHLEKPILRINNRIAVNPFQKIQYKV